MNQASFTGCEVVTLMDGESIGKLLLCPVCQGVPTPPIYMCEKGHNICDTCGPYLMECGLCREPIIGARNFFMESVIYGSTFTCAYVDEGCTAQMKGDQLKDHIKGCQYGPKIRWVESIEADMELIAGEMVRGGTERGIPLYVIRAPIQESNTPGKLLEYLPPRSEEDELADPPPGYHVASISWGGAEHPGFFYEILLAKPGYYDWVKSQNGDIVPGAVRGGMSEDGETLYIGRFPIGEDLVVGKIHPSHKVAYVPYKWKEVASSTYEILVELKNKPKSDSSQPHKTDVKVDTQSDASSSMFS